MARETCDDCSLTWDRKGNVKDIVPCKLHASAPALLEALEALTPPDWSLNDPMSLKYGKARAAIEATKENA